MVDRRSHQARLGREDIGVGLGGWDYRGQRKPASIDRSHFVIFQDPPHRPIHLSPHKRDMELTPGMARWLVELEGNRSDLQQFAQWFPGGSVFAVEEDRKFFLTGKAFDQFPDSEAVRNEAIRILAELAGAISILLMSLQKPRLGAIIHQGDAGNQSVFIFASGAAAIASVGVLAVGSVNGGASASSLGTTQAQDLLAAARTSTNLLEAIRVFGHPPRTFPRLYRVLEEIEAYLKQPASKAGLCSVKERERFRRTANTKAAGLDARHALGFSPPATPMSLPEAEVFIRGILKAALDRVAT